MNFQRVKENILSFSHIIQKWSLRAIIFYTRQNKAVRYLKLHEMPFSH